jgi:hypothetical protein
MQNSTDITVYLHHNFDEAQMVINDTPIDFLIIVGYLKDKNNYEIIKAVRRGNLYASVIMYAVIDDCIEHECSNYNINNKFHRREPIAAFIKYMRLCYNEGKPS